MIRCARWRRHFANTPRRRSLSRRDHGGRNHGNRLFDAGWYVGRYPDIAAAGIEPVEHYAQFGQTEARAPNAYFDEAFYRLKVGKIDGLIPLLHYARAGEAANLAPGPCFDPAWYRHAYALPRSVSALADFLRNRATMKRLPTQTALHPTSSGAVRGVSPDVDCFPLIFAELSAGEVSRRRLK